MDVVQTGAGVLLMVFGATVLCGKLLLPVLQRLKMGQTVRDDGPKSHYVKSGTPTIGGLMFIVPWIVMLALGVVLSFSRETLGIALMVLTMGAIGFVDDFVKVRVSKDGLSAGQKTVPMLVLCLAFALVYAYVLRPELSISWPFTATVTPVLGLWKPIYVIFLTIFMYYTINAVNLTDGVDGLLSSISLPVFLSLALIFNYFNKSAMAVYALGIVGGLIGFLLYNRHPARVFMGDTGSLAIGAFYACFVVLADAPWLLFLSGGVYFFEAFSVVMQVVYFKSTGGKRIFRMSPIHHHFELGGWSENKIVTVFTLVAAVLSAVSVAAFMVR